MTPKLKQPRLGTTMKFKTGKVSHGARGVKHCLVSVQLIVVRLMDFNLAALAAFNTSTFFCSIPFRECHFAKLPMPVECGRLHRA